MIVKDYAFDASARTVTFTGVPDLRLEGIKLITNLPDGVIIYQFNAPAKGGTVSGNVLTLDHDTTTMNDADELMIIYDAPGDGELTVRIEELATYTYVGHAAPGSATSAAVWRVKRITNSSGHVLYADGNAFFDNIWDNRASLSYT